MKACSIVASVAARPQPPRRANARTTRAAIPRRGAPAGCRARPRCRSRAGARAARGRPDRATTSTATLRCARSRFGRGAGTTPACRREHAAQSVGERANGACGPRARAERGAEIHDRLRVVRDALVRRVRFRVLARARPPRSDRQASLRPRDSARARASRCRRGSASVDRNACARIAPAVERPMPGNACSVVERLRHAAAVRVPRRCPRRALQVARARVVAEAGPQRQHVVERRRGERAHGREALHEAHGSTGSPWRPASAAA